MATHDDTAQTWRDVADQLIAAQIAQLERPERDEPQTLLQMAREWAAKTPPLRCHSTMSRRPPDHWLGPKLFSQRAQWPYRFPAYRPRFRLSANRSRS
jgi:hypothetical protein